MQDTYSTTSNENKYPLEYILQYIRFYLQMYLHVLLVIHSDFCATKQLVDCSRK